MAKRVKSNKTSVTTLLNKISGQVSSRAYSSADSVAKKVATDVYHKSQEYVPEDTGELRESGEVVQLKEGHYEVVYTAPHAFYLENNIPSPPENKNYTRPGSGPFYLTRAIDEVASDREVVGAMRDEFGRFTKRLPKGN